MLHSYYLTLNPSPRGEGLDMLQILVGPSPLSPPHAGKLTGGEVFGFSIRSTSTKPENESPGCVEKGLGILLILAESSPLAPHRGPFGREGPGVRFSDLAFLLPLLNLRMNPQDARNRTWHSANLIRIFSLTHTKKPLRFSTERLFAGNLLSNKYYYIWI